MSDLIERLSEFRSQYNCFNESEEPYYRILTEAIEAIREQKEIICCKDCYWWTKQEDSLQGRCDRYGMYPTGYWYCTAAREGREE